MLQAAARVIGERGPHALTLAAVGQACGLSAAAVQRRFGSKRALMLALFDLGLQQARDAFEDADAAHEGLQAVIEGLAGAAEGIVSHVEAAHHLATLADDLLDVERRARTQAYQHTLEAEVARRIGALVQAGQLTEVDPEGLARQLVLTQAGALLRWSIAADAPDQRCADAVRAALRWVVRHYGTSPGEGS
ncbi:MAG: TetR/AcrR family transcriptional regulator [Myxococcales bacterium]|nr:TetR/AcrR family transcriptional regulator [Myxococcales bacterium]